MDKMMNKEIPMLYARTSTGAIQTWKVVVEDNKYKTIVGQLDGKKVESEFTICEGKNLGKKNETLPCEQAYKEALSNWKNKKDQHGYFESIKDIDNEIHFEPMLAKTYDGWLSIDVYTQPKLDGMRTLIKKDGLWSRNGKQVLSAPHIFNKLKPLFDENPKLILDGELFSDKLKDNFEKMMSLVRKSKPTLEDLKESEETVQYWIYDLPSSGKSFGARWIELKDLLKDVIGKEVKLTPTYYVTSQEELDEKYQEFLKDGQEGQMIRIDAPYEQKRSKYLLKRKEFVDEEFVVIDIIEGEGNRRGMFGKAKLQLEDGKTFEANARGNEDRYIELLKNKKDYIGKSATVRYQNRTSDNIPRFPVIVDWDRSSYE